MMMLEIGASAVSPNACTLLLERCLNDSCCRPPPARGVNQETLESYMHQKRVPGVSFPRCQEHALRLIRYPGIDLHVRNSSGRGAAAIASICGYHGANTFVTLLPRGLRTTLWSRSKGARAGHRTLRDKQRNQGIRSRFASDPSPRNSPSEWCYDAVKLNFDTYPPSGRRPTSRLIKLHVVGVSPAAGATDRSTHRPVLEGGNNQEEGNGCEKTDAVTCPDMQQMGEADRMIGDTPVSKNLTVGGNGSHETLEPLSVPALPPHDGVMVVSVATQTDMIPALNPPQPRDINEATLRKQVSALNSQEGAVRANDGAQRQLTRVSGSAVLTPLRQDGELDDPPIAPATVAEPEEFEYTLKSEPKPATVISGPTALIELQNKELTVGGGATEEPDANQDRVEGTRKEKHVGNADEVATGVPDPLTVKARNCDGAALTVMVRNGVSATCAHADPTAYNREVSADITHRTDMEDNTSICSESGTPREENVQASEGYDVERRSVPEGCVEDTTATELWTKVDGVTREIQRMLLEDVVQEDGECYSRCPKLCGMFPNIRLELRSR